MLIRLFSALKTLFYNSFALSLLSATIINVPADSSTIQAGIDGATDGDTVLVQPGTYIENINFNGKNIVVGSLFLTTQDTSYILSTIVDGNQSGSVVTFANGEDSTALLNGFTITNGNGTNVSGIQRFGGGIYSYNSSNPIISDCIITGNSAGAGSGGGISCYYASATIKNCIIRDNTNHGISNAFGAGIMVVNCLIRDNYASDYGGGIHAGGGSSPTIINCTIVNNDSYHHTSTGIYAISGGTVLNSIVRDNIGPDILIIQGTTNVTYSNIEGGYTGTGNIDTDPLFIDSTNNDYRLTDNSPCIGSGLNTSLVPAIDLDGNLRPNPVGSNPDMGAYENSLGVPLNESPLTPQDLTATPDNQQVTLSWSPNTESDIYKYNIYRVNMPPAAMIDSVFHPDTTYADTGLTNGTTYHYRISAVDSSGNESAPTDVVNGTPNPVVITVNVDGTEDYLTIQSAVDASTNADTILVYPGIYPDPIDFTNKNVVITSTDGPSETIIHCTVYISNSSSVFKGFTISDQNRGLLTGGNQSMTIENNVFKNIDQEAIRVRYDWSKPVIRNNLVDGARFGISIENNGSAEIINNTIVNCTETAIQVRDTSTAKIYNTIIWDNTQSLNWLTNNPPDQVEIYNSNLYGGWSGIGSGNINQDPYFVNPDSNNFLLKNFSSCIGTGLDTSIAPNTDIDGNPRPNPPGSNPDMGAYENPLAERAHNTSIYVSTTGNDTGSIGLLMQPFASIQTAIDYAQDEDTILVNQGTYVENINFTGKNIVVGSLTLTTGDTSYISQTIIDGNQDTSVVIFSNGETSAAVFSGFTIKNGNSLFGGGILCLGSNPTLENVIISGNSANYGGGIYCSGSSPTLKNVSISDNSADYGGGITIEHTSNPIFTGVIISSNTAGGNAGGINCAYSSNPVLTDVIISSNTAGNFGGGIALQSACHPVLNHVLISGNTANSGGGLNIFSSNITFTNVTMYGNAATSLGGGIYAGHISADDSTNVSLVNTILCNNSPEEVYFDGAAHPSNITVSYSNVLGGPDSMVTNDNGTVNWGAGNIDIDSRFVNAANDNYNLLASSQCINAGHPDSTDADGTRVDMGAYPYINTYSGPDWYVSTTGNDITATGAFDNPFASIQAGINFATTTGDSVSVAAGTYVENINFRGRAVKVFGEEGAENTIIDGNHNGAVITCESGENHNSILKGFTIKNGYRTHGGGIFCSNGSPTLSDLIIKNNTAVYHGGGISCDGSNPNITNVLITDNTSVIDDGGGIWLAANSNPVLINVSIVGNNANTKGGGIICTASSHPSIINSILWNNIPGEIYFDFEPSYGPDSITISYSDIQGGQDSIVTNNGMVNWLSDNIDLYPEFIDSANGDFRLADTSPCIARGADSVQIAGTWYYAPTTDLDGNPRPNTAGTNPDMGAYESPVGVPYVVTEVHNLDIGESENISHLVTHTPPITFNYYSVLGDPQTQYHVQVSSHSDYSIIDTWDTGATAGNDTAITYSGDTLIDGNEYYLRVKVASGEFWSDWSSLQFRMNSLPTIPVTIYPTFGIIVDEPINLMVENSSDPEGDTLQYRFSVFDDIDLMIQLDSSELVSEGAENTSWQITATLPDNGQYFWIVEAYDGYEFSEQSVPQSFLVNTENNVPEPFSLVYPESDGEVSTLTPIFTWNVSFDLDPMDGVFYTLYLDTPEPGVELFDAEMDTTFQLTEPLWDNTEYFWKIVAKDLMGFETNNEAGYQRFFTNFQNDPPSSVILITPTDNSIEIDLSPLFYWTESVDPDPLDTVSYRLFIDSDSSFANSQGLDLDTNGFDFGVLNTILNDNSAYYWTVDALDNHESVTGSDTLLFWTDAFPEPPNAFASIVPTDSTEGLEPTVEFIWHSTTDPDPLDQIQYRLVYAPDWTDSSTYALVENIIDTTISITLSNNAEYFWLIEAIDKDSMTTACNAGIPYQFIVGTLVTVEEVVNPVKFTLHQNYPNPFNPITTIQYDLPEASNVQIVIYDLLGRQVKSLVNQVEEPGYKQVIWDATNSQGLPVGAGVYFYQIKAGGYIQTRKMLLLK